MMIQYIQRDLTNAYFVNISNWKAYIPNCRVYPFWNNRGKGGVLAVSVRIKYRSKSILLWWFFLFYVLVFKIFLCCWRLMYVCIFLVKLR